MDNREAWALVQEHDALIKSTVRRYVQTSFAKQNEVTYDDLLSGAYMVAHAAALTFDPSKATYSTWVYTALRTGLRDEVIALGRGARTPRKAGNEPYAEPVYWNRVEFSDDADDLQPVEREARSAMVEPSFEYRTDAQLDWARDLDWHERWTATVAELSPIDRDIVERHAVREESLSSIAKGYGYSTSWASNRWRKAREHLRRALPE